METHFPLIQIIFVKKTSLNVIRWSSDGVVKKGQRENLTTETILISREGKNYSVQLITLLFYNSRPKLGLYSTF